MRFGCRSVGTAVLLAAGTMLAMPLLAQAGDAGGFVTHYGVRPVIHRQPQPLVPQAVYHPLQLWTHFDFDRTKLHLQDRQQLSELSGDLSRLQPAYGMGRYGYLDGGQIVGNTDSIGTYSYNDALSRRRALTVQRYLQTQGLGTGNLAVYGLGKRDPIASNATAEGRAHNRRTDIDLRLLTLPPPPKPGWPQ